MKTVGLLIASDVFMTLAWYGHLKYKSAPLWKAIMVSWLIAFVEYCLQVPANRIGHARFSAAQLRAPINMTSGRSRSGLGALGSGRSDP